MQHIYELNLWSHARQEISDGFAYDLCIRAENELDLPEGILFPQGAIPDQTDVMNLEIALEESELSRHSFIEFCVQKQLSPNRSDLTSAAKYLEHSYGRLLAWIHLPHDSSGEKLFMKLSKWVRKNDCVIQYDHISCCPIVNHANDLVGWRNV